MKRTTFLMVVMISAGFAAGCERNDATSGYNPKLDGVNPPAARPVDLSILDNQRDLVAKAGGGITVAPVTPAPAAAATTTAPSTSTAVEATTTPAPEKATPAAPAAGGDIAPPPSN
jgi:hypothetical protein